MPISLADFTKQNNMTENEMTGLLLKLADLGVTGIKIFYSGGGDSGDIDDVVYTTIKEASFYDIMNLSNYGQENTLYLATLDGYLRDDLIDFANEKILNGIEDWWNNDGGYGVMLIKIPSGEYEINNTIYVTDTEEFGHEGDLISKSLE